MPVALSKMMRNVPSARRAEIEIRASALAADVCSRRVRLEQVYDAESHSQIAIGTKAMTGQRCPKSGFWKVEQETTTSMLSIPIGAVMPTHAGRVVTWILARYA